MLRPSFPFLEDKLVTIEESWWWNGRTCLALNRFLLPDFKLSGMIAWLVSISSRTAADSSLTVLSLESSSVRRSSMRSSSTTLVGEGDDEKGFFDLFFLEPMGSGGSGGW